MAEERTLGQKLKRGFESKVLVPLAVTVVSAAASYLAKKLPLLLEEKILPKLREQGGAEGVRDAVIETATAVKERAAEIVPSLPAAEASGNGTPSSAGQESGDEREEERRQRAERRQKRKLQKA